MGPPLFSLIPNPATDYIRLCLTPLPSICLPVSHFPLTHLFPSRPVIHTSSTHQTAAVQETHALSLALTEPLDPCLASYLCGDCVISPTVAQFCPSSPSGSAARCHTSN